MKELTKDEKFLLLFLEDTVVNQWGIVDDLRKVSPEELEKMKEWNKIKFVLSKRVHRNKGEQIHLTYAIRLSDDAWNLAQEERKAKALRHIPEELL